MSQSKKAYFQGTEEPTPKKKKYKSEPALVNQPRFKEPFYRNYDLYDTPGEHSPGSGYHHMLEFKSVKDFLNDRRKKMKGKYKADDSWQLDNGTRVKKKARSILLNRLIKVAIDFPIDEQVTPSHYSPVTLGPFGRAETPPVVNLKDYSTYSDPLGISGRGDRYLPLPDEEGKSADKLNFGRDYFPGCPNCGFVNNKETGEIFDTTFPCPQCEKGGVNNKYLNPAEPDLYGLPDGIDPPEDLDAPSNENPQYGVTDSGSTIYNKI